MSLLVLAATISVSLDPIASLDLLAHLHLDTSCLGPCSVSSGALLFATGETAAVAFEPGRCSDSVPLDHLPFGAHLIPRVVWTCDGQAFTATGTPINIPPRLTNVAIDGTTVWVPALAEPRGLERVRLRIWAPDAGFDLSHDFASRELVLHDVELPESTLYFRATLEPYGIASNTRVVQPDPPSLRWTASSQGCASTPPWVFFVFFLRRRFPFLRPFC